MARFKNPAGRARNSGTRRPRFWCHSNCRFLQTLRRIYWRQYQGFPSRPFFGLCRLTLCQFTTSNLFPGRMGARLDTVRTRPRHGQNTLIQGTASDPARRGICHSISKVPAGFGVWGVGSGYLTIPWGVYDRRSRRKHGTRGGSGGARVAEVEIIAGFRAPSCFELRA